MDSTNLKLPLKRGPFDLRGMYSKEKRSEIKDEEHCPDCGTMLRMNGMCRFCICGWSNCQQT